TGEVELALHHQRRHVHEIEPRGEVLALRKHDAAAALRIVLELDEGVAQRAQHVGVESVHLGRPIEADEKQWTAFFGGDLRGVAQAPCETGFYCSGPSARGGLTGWGRNRSSRPGYQAGATVSRSSTVMTSRQGRFFPAYGSFNDRCAPAGRRGSAVSAPP